MPKRKSEGSNNTNRKQDGRCIPCDIAAAIGVTRNICDGDGSLDCSELDNMLNKSEEYTMDDALNLLRRIREQSQGWAREQMELVIKLAEEGS